MFFSFEISSILNSIKPQRDINVFFSPDAFFLPNNTCFSFLYTETLILSNLEIFKFLGSSLVKKHSSWVSNDISVQSNFEPDFQTSKKAGSIL